MITTLLLSASLLVSQPTLLFDEAFEQKSIVSEAQVYASSDKMSAGDARAFHERGGFLPAPATGMVYPVRPKYYWIQFAVKNHSDKARVAFIEVRNAHLNHIQLFNYVHGHAKMHASPATGDQLPFSSREINNRFFVFKVTLQAGETREFLLNTDKYNESIKIPIVLRSESNFYGNAASETTLIGLYIGVYCVVIACLIVFCVVGFSVLRASLLVYVLGLSLVVVSNSGLGMQFLWGNLPVLNSLSRSLFSSVGAMALLVFCYFYFDMHLHAASRISKFHRWVSACFAIILLLLDLYFYWVAFDNPWQRFIAIGAAQSGLLLLPIYVIALSAYFVFARYQVKNILFLVSNVGVLAAISSLSLEEIGIAKDVFFTESVLFASLLLDFTTLASIVAVDFYRIRTENRKLTSSLEQAVLEGAKNFLEGQQIERKRLAIQVHDGASVRLAAVQMKLSSLNTSDIQSRDELLKEIRVVSQDIRNFSHNLSSVVLEEYGFVNAVEELILFLEEADSQFLFEFDYDDNKIDSKTIERELYFVCLELVNNAIKHSSGNIVKIAFSVSEKGYELLVHDNGQGYKPNSNKTVGLGLKGIDWRLRILSGELDVFHFNGLQTHAVKIPRY